MSENNLFLHLDQLNVFSDTDTVCSSTTFCWEYEYQKAVDDQVSSSSNTQFQSTSSSQIDEEFRRPITVSAEIHREDNNDDEDDDFLPKSKRFSQKSKSTSPKTPTKSQQTVTKSQQIVNNKPVTPIKLNSPVKLRSNIDEITIVQNKKINIISDITISSPRRKLITTETSEKTKNVEVQTVNNSVNAIVNNNSLKRKLNVSMQVTENDIEISTKQLNGNEKQMTPTKYNKQTTINPESNELTSPPKKVKTNELLLTPVKSSNNKNNSSQRSKDVETSTEESCTNEKQITPAEYKKKSTSKPTESLKKTPVKSNNQSGVKYSQLKISEFYISKKTPSPKQQNLKEKSPKKDLIKKDSRYTLESHKRLYANVKKIVVWVLENHHFNILFTKQEINLLNKLFNFEDERLTFICLRLFTRQPKWYNLENFCRELNLQYEGYNLREILNQLTSQFVCYDYSNEDLQILLEYLSVQDVKDICNSFKIKPPTRKDASISKLIEYTSKQCTLTFVKNSHQILRERVKQKLGLCVKLDSAFKNILYRVHLLYSLTNPELEKINDIYNYMYNLSSDAVKLPNIELNATNIFAERYDFLRFTEATLLRKEYYEQFEKKDLGSQYSICVEAHKKFSNLLSDVEQVDFDKKKPLYVRRFSAAWVYAKVLTSGTKNLGKHYPDDVCKWLENLLSQNLYCAYKRGHWYIQLSLVRQAHKKQIIQAAECIIEGINDKYVTETTKYELSIRGSKIKQNKISQLLFDNLQCALLPFIKIPVERNIEATPVVSNESGRKLNFVRITSEGKEYSSVEETAINYYIEQKIYSNGIHCEGQLFNFLFVTFFWNILFHMDIPNTFITEIQKYPLDLFSTDFFYNRSAEIRKTIDDIKNNQDPNEICDIFSNIYNENSLELKSLTGFDFSNEQIFYDVIKCIGNKVLAAVFERFAKDYKQFHSGLPDLFLWDKTKKECAFVEVKSENDKLSTKQILWINYLHSFGAKVEVCYVQNVGSKSKQKKNKKG